MTVKEQLVESLRLKAGYDMFTACEIADRTIAEFLESGVAATTIGIMSGKKCVQVFELRNANGR